MKIKTKIPISREILADMETPLSVFRKLANGPYSYLFESVEGGENWARYSLIGLESSKVFFIKKNLIEIKLNGEIIESFQCEDQMRFEDENGDWIDFSTESLNSSSPKPETKSLSSILLIALLKSSKGRLSFNLPSSSSKRVLAFSISSSDSTNTIK